MQSLLSIPFPEINAGLNALSACLLIAGYVWICAGKLRAHRIAMLGAFGVSGIFLISYIVHKIIQQGVHTPFGGEGIWRWIYYPMLLSHILLAMGMLPMIFVTIGHALRGRWDQHRRWARITLPGWLYVSVTGVLVYAFLYQWFP
jgi:putative membrane protein